MVVNIPLDSRYGITADHHQWILLLDQRPHWFFPDLLSLLQSYLEVKFRDCNVRDIQQLIHYQNQLTERLIQTPNTHLKQTAEAKLPLIKNG